MSEEFRSYDNVIYEICNEPQNSPWDSVIKPYAEEVIPCIRANDSDAIILVGTNTWSQDIDEVVGNQLDDANTMYVVHFYAGTHKDDLRNRVKSALDAGVPVFVSECSISDASGNGSLDYESGQAWVDLLNSYQVSFVTWSLSNKEESSALLRSDCTSISGWSDEELSDAGKWWKQRIHGQ
jgi:endoglucanase